jgi:hypothetical protein
MNNQVKRKSYKSQPRIIMNHLLQLLRKSNLLRKKDQTSIWMRLTVTILSTGACDCLLKLSK